MLSSWSPIDGSQLLIINLPSFTGTLSEAPNLLPADCKPPLLLADAIARVVKLLNGKVPGSVWISLIKSFAIKFNCPSNFFFPVNFVTRPMCPSLRNECPFVNNCDMLFNPLNVTPTGDAGKECEDGGNLNFWDWPASVKAGAMTTLGCLNEANLSPSHPWVYFSGITHKIPDIVFRNEYYAQVAEVLFSENSGILK